MRGVPANVGGVSSVFLALLFALVVPSVFGQMRTPLVTDSLATVYRIDLPAGTRTTVTPTSAHGIVWVAITDGTVVVGGVAREVKQGSAEWLEGATPVAFRAADAKAAQFVIADLSMALQGDRIQNWASSFTIGPSDPNDPTKARSHRRESLEPGGSIQEHTPQGATLFVAVAPLVLKDQIDLADEDEPLRLSEPTLMKLAAGQVRWTKPGLHLFTNVSKTNARFVMIKW
jgi:hypothetical protein